MLDILLALSCLFRCVTRFFPLLSIPSNLSPRLRMPYLSPIDAKPPYRPSLTSYHEPVTHRRYNGKWIENQQAVAE